MAKQLGVADNVSYTCETAAHFWLLHILARWEKFLAVVQQRRTPGCVKVCTLYISAGIMAPQHPFPGLIPATWM